VVFDQWEGLGGRWLNQSARPASQLPKYENSFAASEKEEMMTNAISQPARWSIAANTASDAAYDLQELREEWVAMRDEFMSRWSTKRDELTSALDTLVDLQEDYSKWAVPFSLSDGKVQEMLNEVADNDFQRLRDAIPDLENITDPIESFDAEDLWWNCWQAKATRPPKGYGRDYAKVAARG
jgi:hypothetical protein